MDEERPKVPPHVAAFNSKVSDLLKQVKPEELTDVLHNSSSLLRSAAADNQNQNQGGKLRERE
jgi:hypothetical protein